MTPEPSNVLRRRRDRSIDPILAALILSSLVLFGIAQWLAWPARAAEASGGPTLTPSSCYVSLGDTVPIVVAGAAPGRRVIFAGALDDGPITVMGLMVCLGPTVGAIVQLGEDTADAGGAARFEVRVPAGRTGLLDRDIFFQAFVKTGPGTFQPTNGTSFRVVEPGVTEPVFTDASSRITAVEHPTAGIAGADIDLDGDLDLVTIATGTGSATALQILVNQGGDQAGQEGMLVDEASSRVDTNGVNDEILDSISVAVGDVTGDGFPEIVLGGDDFADPGGPANRPNYLFVNRGDGTFVADAAFPAGGFETHSIALADVNGDLEVDIILGNGTDAAFPEPAQLLLNSGGTFTLDPSFPGPTGEFDDTLAVDVDGVNGVDVLFVADGQNVLLLNDGSGSFTDATSTGLPVLADNSSAGDAGDIDGDGDLDIVIFNIGQPSYWLENDADENPGQGVFTQRILPSLGPNLFLILDGTLEDFDQDGDLDIVFAIHTLGGGEPMSSMLLNQGGIQGGTRGTFVKHTTFDGVPAAAVGNGIVTGDVDGDGDADICLANAGDFGFPEPEEGDVLLINRGCGSER